MGQPHRRDDLRQEGGRQMNIELMDVALVATLIGLLLWKVRKDGLR